MVVGKKSRLKLITMNSSKDVYTALVNDLVVSDLDENVAILLPDVLSRPAMPVGRDEIPKQEDVERWLHLSRPCVLIRSEFRSGSLDWSQCT